jgi:hypothetical protein
VGLAGRWDWTGASDLNPTAEIACERPKQRQPAGDGGVRRRAAADGGGARRRTRSRAPVQRLTRGRHLDEACETAKQLRVAEAAARRTGGAAKELQRRL